MFSELPKLFDRDFAIGYLLPAAGFLIANIFLKAMFGLFPHLMLIKPNDLVFNTGSLGLSSLLLSILLLVLNWEAYRFLEGYGSWNPFQLMAWFQRRQFQRLRSQFDAVQASLTRSNEEENGDTANLLKLRAERTRIGLQLADDYPDDERWLRPTAFGNAIRAFEVYPRIMYGLGAIPGWERLQAVIPEDYRKLVSAAKAPVDFWVNIWLLSIVVIGEYIVCAVKVHHLPAVWLPLLSLGCCLLASSRAKSAAIGWGAAVKASFDVFLPELRKKLGFVAPATLQEERQFWQRYTSAITYRLPEYLDNRDSTMPVESKLPSTQSVPKSVHPEIEQEPVHAQPLLHTGANQLASEISQVESAVANPHHPDGLPNRAASMMTKSEDTLANTVNQLLSTDLPNGSNTPALDQSPNHVSPVDLSGYEAVKPERQISDKIRIKTEN